MIIEKGFQKEAFFFNYVFTLTIESLRISLNIYDTTYTSNLQQIS